MFGCAYGGGSLRTRSRGQTPGIDDGIGDEDEHRTHDRGVRDDAQQGRWGLAADGHWGLLGTDEMVENGGRDSQRRSVKTWCQHMEPSVGGTSFCMAGAAEIGRTSVNLAPKQSVGAGEAGSGISTSK
jgi:hypothetical protein